MIDATWLFQNHTSHLVIVKILTNALSSAEQDREYFAKYPAAEIEGLALTRTEISPSTRPSFPLDTTERTVIKVEQITSCTEYLKKQRQLKQYQWYIQLYDLLLDVLTPRERWFIEQHYNHKCSLVSLTQTPGSPFEGYDRSSVWKFKKRLLTKANAVLHEA